MSALDLITWPDDVLPIAPFSADYLFQVGDARVRTSFDQGTPRQRLVNDLAYDVYMMRWLWDALQYEIYRGFIDSALRDGDWFLMPVWMDNAYQLLQVRFVQGSIDRRERQDGRWNVSAKLEGLGAPVMNSVALTAHIGPPLDDGSLQPWPVAVLEAEPLNETFAHVIPDDLNRDDLTYGKLDQVRHQRQKPAIYEWSMPFVDNDFAVFRGFLYWRARKGMGWFTMPMFRGGSYETQAVRVVAGTLKAGRAAGDWLVSCQLEVADLAPWSAEQTFAAMAAYGDPHSFEDIVAALGDLVGDYQTAVT